VEPLEATSIFGSVLMLRQWEISIDGFNQNDKKTIKIFNAVTRRMNKDILNFIHLHYLTKRNDSEFWTSFKDKNKTPAFVENFLEITKTTIPEQSLLDYLNAVETSKIDVPQLNYKCMYDESSWLQVCSGIKYFDPSIAKQILDKDYKDFDKKKFDLKKLFEIQSENLFDHYNYIQHINHDY
jgi:hypothetical protein